MIDTTSGAEMTPPPPTVDPRPFRHRSPYRSRAVWLGIMILLIGITIGRLIGQPGAVAQNDGTAATATRQAELTELAALQTRVASPQPPVVCSPAVTPTALPSPTTVPPAPAGQALPYGDNWTVTVGDAAVVRPTTGDAPLGQFLRVNFTIVNGGTTQRAFTFQDLVLVDETGRIFLVSFNASTLISPSWYFPMPPSLPTEIGVVYDIAADAQGPYIIESKTDPTFRVAVAQEERG